MPGQSWDPASPVFLMVLVFTEELLVLVLPRHEPCSAASLLSGERRPCRSSSSKGCEYGKKRQSTSFPRADPER